MKRPKFVVYEAKDGWRWRYVAPNGRIIADSAEAYTRKRDAKRAVYRLRQLILQPVWVGELIWTMEL